MTMRAVHQLYTTTGTDGYGHLLDASWTTTGDPVACYAWVGQNREVQDGDKITVVADFVAIWPRGQAITDEDRFSQIQDRQGNVIFSGPINIDSIDVKPTHLELKLRRSDSGPDVDL